ncbi:hypothetical protein Ngar_c29100 [Candidatus Nitrososphaera gargensis Ga9.2]|uniref:Nucleotidyl transferase AbiEii/AbiGii toxin family protein n=1 Tax=Nitrososphaera gargensis (strain Ga9.2) TaxID=1237085 RepID=K0INR4_NITGG|nr:hypothetical protein [Candidatus Nitrososphaera gargensis]AFU59829.1 hypothetical protein Ngar_c29100 [Candidatus Nitrososphaera gargensis Ga9.2]
MSKIQIFRFLFQADPKIMNIQSYKQIAEKKGWRAHLTGPLVSMVERDILTFDTFSILATMANDELSFGGGTLLNWIQLCDSPRFSFDVDTQLQFPARTKQEVMTKIIEPINDSLRKSGKVTPIEINGKKFEVGLIYFDREKDHFPNMLSLKRSVHALTIGRDAHEYLRKEMNGLTDKEVMKLKSMYGGKFGKIEDVRIEIGFSESGDPKFPSKATVVEPLVNPEAGLTPVEAKVTVIEHTIASKIFRLGKRYTDAELEFAIPEFIKAISDLRYWESANLDEILEYIRQISASENYSVMEILDSSDNMLDWLKSERKAKDQFERGAQTSMLATKIGYLELINNSSELVQKIRQKV